MSVGGVEPARDRLDELEQQWNLAPAARAGLEEFLSILAADPQAPTTVRDPASAVDIHIADALSGLAVPELRAAHRIADLGSGAGVPGLPLALALSGAAVFLVESNGRKADFLARAAAQVSASNATVVALRAEEWVDGRLACDVITARALAPLAVLAEYAAPLLRPGGVLVAWKGRRDPREEEGGARAAEVLGLRGAEPIAVDIGPQAMHRHLHVLRKVAETPQQFPRRPGVASKRPLG